MRTALIATIKNEAPGILAFLESIRQQTRRPDIIVIVDGGSTDGTIWIVWDWQRTHEDDISYFVVPGNRSLGRNTAVRLADAYYIACTNCSVLAPDWFERIIAPMKGSIEGEADVDVVGGTYIIDPDLTPREQAAAFVTQYDWHEVVEKKFVSALSMAFTTRVWEAVGGFPEYLDTSEDIVFVQSLHDAGAKFAYVPAARVYWRPATLTLREAYQTYKRFARTDAQADVLHAQYAVTMLAYAVPLLAALVNPVLGLFLLGSWLTFRIRKVLNAGLVEQVPYAMAMVVAVDMGRLRGYL